MFSGETPKLKEGIIMKREALKRLYGHPEDIRRVLGVSESSFKRLYRTPKNVWTLGRH
jgi:hypothetical protein